ncbi:glycosyltransferase family 2 protein [Agromyces intestinalis]|uniref:Glycosyltransferase family 2 protein n=1 Tax=Agromyces intestinalis TaxID=2592652 RepID=A0A5C1YMZ4_9MICO|nr:glycosyltransferase family 2 protein [Agromyces intestinalis]
MARDLATAPPGRFAGPDEAVDVAIVVVTYQSADDLDRLIASLRHEAGHQRLRVIVADNASSDATLHVARGHSDLVVAETGGNLGYAGGINAAMASIGEADAILVLNPDLVVEPGAVAALRARLRESRAGIVVPKILDADGETYPSIRREPTLLRALGDAAFGSRFASRPGAFAEVVSDGGAYENAHPLDWATGAALLIDAGAARTIGPWDERFFLYSEETDFFRRARDLGYAVWFEPTAVVRHTQGGSGASVDLERLMAVNRIRYARKHHGRVAAAAYRGAVVLHELARAWMPAHRATLRTVASERTWADLPRASRPTRAGSGT